MKRLTQPETRRGANAWGQSSVSIHELFEIEESDVGRTRENYRGFGHSSHRFSLRDVGRVIDIISDGTGWTCWFFEKSLEDQTGAPGPGGSR